jgi:hypothetical protein
MDSIHRPESPVLAASQCSPPSRLRKTPPRLSMPAEPRYRVSPLDAMTAIEWASGCPPAAAHDAPWLALQ